MAAFKCKTGVSLFDLVNGIPLGCTIISKFLLLPLTFFLHWAFSAFVHLCFHLVLATVSTALVLSFWHTKKLFSSSNMNQPYCLMQNSPLCFPSNLLETLQQRSWHTHEHIRVKNVHKGQSRIKARNKDLLTLLEEALNMPVTFLLSFLFNVALIEHLF